MTPRQPRDQQVWQRLVHCGWLHEAISTTYWVGTTIKEEISKVYQVINQHVLPTFGWLEMLRCIVLQISDL